MVSELFISSLPENYCLRLPTDFFPKKRNAVFNICILWGYRTTWSSKLNPFGTYVVNEPNGLQMVYTKNPADFAKISEHQQTSFCIV
jgi:hypothetical protein